jgi:ABC-type sugar transport system ATPase subunit
VGDRIVVLGHGRKVLDVEKDRVTPEDIIDVIAHRKTPQEVLGRR